MSTFAIRLDGALFVASDAHAKVHTPRFSVKYCHDERQYLDPLVFN